MAAGPAVLEKFLDSEEDEESDADTSEIEEAKADVAPNNSVVNNDDADVTSGEGESEEAESDSSSMSAKEDVAEDVVGEDEIDVEESDASSSSPVEDDLLDAHLKKLERLEKGETSSAPAEENQLAKTSSGEAGENKASTSEATPGMVLDSNHVASSKLAANDVVMPKTDQIEKNDAKNTNIDQKGKKHFEEDETTKKQDGETEEKKGEKPKELTKAERKALREKMYQKSECDVIDVSTTVYVGNFPRKCSTKDIKKFFSLCGEIEEVVHPKKKIDDKWVPLGWAFVRFKTSEAAKLARMGTGAKVHGRRITIQKRKKPAKRIPLRGGRSVLVKNLSYDAIEKDIEAFFERAGKVETVRLLRNKKSRSLGLAFVDFEDMDGAYKAIEELNGRLFMDRAMNITTAWKSSRPKPGKSMKSMAIVNLPMGTTRDDVKELLEEKVGLCHVRMGTKLRTCVVDFVTHRQWVALNQLELELKGTKLKMDIPAYQRGRYVNPILAQKQPVIIIEPVPLRITEEELLKELKTDLYGIKYIAIIPGAESNKAYVIFEPSVGIKGVLRKKVVTIRGREAKIIKWKPPEEIIKEVKPPTKVFGCRVNKLPKKLSKKRFLDLAEKLIGKREFSLIWELNPKRKKFSGTVELIFEQLEDARYAKEAFEEFVVPGTCRGLKVFISERQSDGLWTKKIEDLFEIRGLPRPTENTKKRSLQGDAESCSKRVRQDDSIEPGEEQEKQSNQWASSSEKSENSKKRLLKDGEEASASKRVKQEMLKDNQEKSNSNGKEHLSESWQQEKSATKQVVDERAKTPTEQEPSSTQGKDVPV